MGDRKNIYMHENLRKEKSFVDTLNSHVPASDKFWLLLTWHILAQNRLRDQKNEKFYNGTFYSEPYFSEALRLRWWSQFMCLCILKSSEWFAVPSETSSALEAADHAQGAPQLSAVSRDGQIFHFQINRELDSWFLQQSTCSPLKYSNTHTRMCTDLTQCFRISRGALEIGDWIPPSATGSWSQTDTERFRLKRNMLCSGRVTKNLSKFLRDCSCFKIMAFLNMYLLHYFGGHI